MRRVTSAIVAALVALTLVGPTAAWANGSDVVAAGTCSAASTTRLKLSRDNAGIEVEAEVDQGTADQVWKVKVVHNGVIEYRFKRVTKSPSGSFTARRTLTDEPGVDRVKVRSRNPSSGEVCVARAKI